MGCANRRAGPSVITSASTSAVTASSTSASGQSAVRDTTTGSSATPSTATARATATEERGRLCKRRTIWRITPTGGRRDSPDSVSSGDPERPAAASASTSCSSNGLPPVASKQAAANSGELAVPSITDTRRRVAASLSGASRTSVVSSEVLTPPSQSAAEPRSAGSRATASSAGVRSARAPRKLRNRSDGTSTQRASSTTRTRRRSPANSSRSLRSRPSRAAEATFGDSSTIRAGRTGSSSWATTPNGTSPSNSFPRAYNTQNPASAAR
nr:hypothetical protein [Pseudosporangium ferrugineum]